MLGGGRHAIEREGAIELGLGSTGCALGGVAGTQDGCRTLERDYVVEHGEVLDGWTSRVEEEEALEMGRI